MTTPEPKKAVEIELDGQAYSLAQGESLFALDGVGSFGVVFGCYSGRCGICRVRVLAGAENLSPRNEMEAMLLSADDGEEVRLACQCEVHGSAAFSSKA